MDEGTIIILSEDEDSQCDDSCNDSVLFVDVKQGTNSSNKVLPDNALSASDEDLVVTYSRRAEVLPHARYDCPVHPFTCADSETGAPVGNNHFICDQCFCYVCDKLASLCPVWCVKDMCHCNSHKKSTFWTSLRNSVVLGYLGAFNLSLAEIDTPLRQAEMMLQSFRKELAAAYTSFLQGKTSLECGLGQSNQQQLVHDYTPVYECVSEFLSKADQQEGRATAIMSLGAAKDFTAHFQPSGVVLSTSPTVNALEAKVILLQRVIQSVRCHMVMSDFTPEFMQKLQGFYQGFHLSSTFKSVKKSLCVRPWDDVLLVSVLKGQNITGIRKDKGKKDVLVEQISVVLLRTELLQHQGRYRELCRYLRVVKTDDSKLFEELQDLIPLYLCKAGDFSLALLSFFSTQSGPATRLSPCLFCLYLCIFDAATAPREHISPQRKPNFGDFASKWEPIEGAVPLKRTELVKFALRVQRLCTDVYTDSRCWTYLLTMVNTPRGSSVPLPEPSSAFLNDSKNVVKMILLNHAEPNIHIPRFFQDVYPDHGLLLLVTEALAMRILCAPLSPVVPVINTFKEITWAFQWLCESLSCCMEVLHSFKQKIQQELGGWENCYPSLPALPSLSERLDHDYCDLLPDACRSTKVQASAQWHLPNPL